MQLWKGETLFSLSCACFSPSMTCAPSSALRSPARSLQSSGRGDDRTLFQLEIDMSLAHSKSVPRRLSSPGRYIHLPQETLKRAGCSLWLRQILAPSRNLVSYTAQGFDLLTAIPMIHLPMFPQLKLRTVIWASQIRKSQNCLSPIPIPPSTHAVSLFRIFHSSRSLHGQAGEGTLEASHRNRSLRNPPKPVLFPGP